MKSVTGILAGVVVLALVVAGVLALTGGSGADERREERKVEQQAGPAGQCGPVTQARATAAGKAFLDRYFSTDGPSAVTGAGPIQAGGGWVLQVNVDPGSRFERAPQCFQQVPVTYTRRGGARG